MDRVSCDVCALDNVLRSFASKKTLNAHRRKDQPHHDPLRVKVLRQCHYHSFADFLIAETRKRNVEESTVSHLVNRWGTQKTARGALSTQFCCFRTEKTQNGTPFKCTAFIRVSLMNISWKYSADNLFCMLFWFYVQKRIFFLFTSWPVLNMLLI
jgi:hypothetical protein